MKTCINYCYYIIPYYAHDLIEIAIAKAIYIIQHARQSYTQFLYINNEFQ